MAAPVHTMSFLNPPPLVSNEWSCQARNILPTLMSLAGFDVAKGQAAIALCNLTANADMRSWLIEKGAVAVLIHLARSSSENTKQECAQAICNLSAMEVSHCPRPHLPPPRAQHCHRPRYHHVANVHARAASLVHDASASSLVLDKRWGEYGRGLG